MSAHTENSIVIDAPIDLVWSMANDVESWPTLFEGEYASVEILEREPGRIVFRLTTEPDERGVVRSWVSERVMDEERHSVTARRLELGPFKYIHIFHAFEPTPDGVRLRWVQDFEIKDGLPFTNEQMEALINKNSTVNLAQHKRLIEEAARSGALS